MENIDMAKFYRVAWFPTIGAMLVVLAFLLWVIR